MIRVDSCQSYLGVQGSLMGLTVASFSCKYNSIGEEVGDGG